MNTSSRNGKIARLPFAIREELNGRLSSGEPGPKLIEWLNALPATQTLLAAEFNGRPISEQNLSEWRSGGYKDWVSERKASAHAARHAGQVADVAKHGISSGALLTNLFAMYAVAMTNWDGSTESPAFAYFQSLKSLAKEILALLKSELAESRIELEREKLEFKKSSTRQQSEPIQSPSVSQTAPSASQHSSPPVTQEATAPSPSENFTNKNGSTPARTSEELIPAQSFSNAPVESILQTKRGASRNRPTPLAGPIAANRPSAESAKIGFSKIGAIRPDSL